MTVGELSAFHRRNILFLRVTHDAYVWICQKTSTELNTYGDTPYWVSLALACLLGAVVVLLTALIDGIKVLQDTLVAIVAFSTIIASALIGGEAINRKIIHTLLEKMSPPVLDQDIWDRFSLKIRYQLWFPLVVTVFLIPFEMWAINRLLPHAGSGLPFFLLLSLVVFTLICGFYTDFTSSTLLARQLPKFVNRLYKFDPAQSPFIYNISDLFATAILYKVIFATFIVLTPVLALPNRYMFAIGTLAALAVLLFAVCTFFYNQNALARLVSLAKANTIRTIQGRIERAYDAHAEKEFTEERYKEIKNLLELSERVSKSRTRILTSEVGFKYLASVVGPVLSLNLFNLDKIIEFLKSFLRLPSLVK